jgi:hypothetical protein
MEKTVATTLARFEPAIRGNDGSVYRARACGRQREDGLWEGWIEFDDPRTDASLRSARETTQSNFSDLTYWASGLTTVYLEGALNRTLAPAPREIVELPPPVFDGPAPDPHSRTSEGAIGRGPIDHEPVLDPFSVYMKSPELLLNELTALRDWHLLRIVRHYELASETEIAGLTEAQLAGLIVRRVRERIMTRQETVRSSS